MRTINYLSALALALFVSFNAAAQQEAITPDGKKVILNDDNTWEYAEEKPKATDDASLDKYTKPADAKSVARSEKIKAKFYYNPAKWKATAKSLNEESEMSFTFSKGDGYAIVISERISMPLETLKEVAFENAREAAEDVRILKEEYRMVNGKKMLCMQMGGTVKGIEFIYYGYYYSDESMTLQYVCMTGKSLFNELKKPLEDMLNGLVID